MQFLIANKLHLSPLRKGVTSVHFTEPFPYVNKKGEFLKKTKILCHLKIQTSFTIM